MYRGQVYGFPVAIKVRVVSKTGESGDGVYQKRLSKEVGNARARARRTQRNDPAASEKCTSSTAIYRRTHKTQLLGIFCPPVTSK